jgi:hypothetical protein
MQPEPWPSEGIRGIGPHMGRVSMSLPLMPVPCVLMCTTLGPTACETI